VMFSVLLLAYFALTVIAQSTSAGISAFTNPAQMSGFTDQRNCAQYLFTGGGGIENAIGCPDWYISFQIHAEY